MPPRKPKSPLLVRDRHRVYTITNPKKWKEWPSARVVGLYGTVTYHRYGDEWFRAVPGQPFSYSAEFLVSEPEVTQLLNSLPQINAS